MTKYITEILKDIDGDVNKLASYKDNYAVKTVLEYAFDPAKKFLLPEGIPPYKQDESPLGMTQANFYQSVKKFYIFNRSDIKPVRIETIFIQLLEGVHPSEAEIICAVKDQNLQSLYPNITAQAVLEAGFITDETFQSYQAAQPKTTKSKGKSRQPKDLVVNLNETVSAKESFGEPADETAKLHPVDVLEKMTKVELDEYAATLGVKLDRRKKKENMIDDLISSF